MELKELGNILEFNDRFIFKPIGAGYRIYYKELENEDESAINLYIITTELSEVGRTLSKDLGRANWKNVAVFSGSIFDLFTEDKEFLTITVLENYKNESYNKDSLHEGFVLSQLDGKKIISKNGKLKIRD